MHFAKTRVVKHKYSTRAITRFYTSNHIEIDSPYGIMLPGAEPVKYVARAPVFCRLSYTSPARPLKAYSPALVQASASPEAKRAVYLSPASVAKIAIVTHAETKAITSVQVLTTLEEGYLAYHAKTLSFEECFSATKPAFVEEAQFPFKVQSPIKQISIGVQSVLSARCALITRESVDRVGVGIRFRALTLPTPFPVEFGSVETFSMSPAIDFITKLLSKEQIGNAQLKPVATRLIAQILSLRPSSNSVCTRLLSQQRILRTFAEDSTFYTARLLTAENTRMFTVLTVVAKLLTREYARGGEEAPRAATKLLTKERVVDIVKAPPVETRVLAHERTITWESLPVETRILTHERTITQESLSYSAGLLSFERAIAPGTANHNVKVLTYEDVRMGV